MPPDDRISSPAPSNRPRGASALEYLVLSTLVALCVTVSMVNLSPMIDDALIAVGNELKRNTRE